MNNKFHRMQIFKSVVEAGSFTGAARTLKMSTPAVSKQVSLLEEEIQIELLRRTTRKTELTESGQLYFLRCNQLLNDFEEMERFSEFLNGEPKGHLKVVVTRHFAERFVIPKLKEFLDQYPQLTLEIEIAERIPDLAKEKIDILFALSLPGYPDWIRKTISKTRYIFCAAPSYLDQFGIPSRPQELIRHRYIAHIMRKPHTSVDFGSGIQLQIEPYLTLNDTQSMLHCAIAGVGIVRLHEYMVAEALRNGTLIEVFPEYNQSEVSIYLFYQQTQFVQPKLRKFIEFFSAALT